MEKTFAGGSKTVKLVNVFSLESFLLYSTKHCNFGSCHIIKSNLILYMVLLRVNSPNLIFIGIVSTSLALGLRSSINLLAISLNGSNKVFRWLCYGHSKFTI